MDKYTLRQNIADYTCKHFFDGKASLKGKIIKDLAALDSDTLMDYYVTLKNQEDYILDELRKMDKKNSFKVPYGRFKYLYGMVQRLIKESRKESVAVFNNNPDQKNQIPKPKPKEVKGQNDPIPAPSPKPKEKPSWMDELTADSQPPKVEEPEGELTYAQRQNLKNFPDGDIPVIMEADLFEIDPDMEAIHEAWASLDESERRRNWEKAIAEHRQ